ncbi:hypothetical protein [Streptomyces sp. NPDC018610]|uniref:hypothetical protein n=1 Tax=Streptomyces sp. NPDC018610 TaxID=3365049 RepID=UPI003794FCCD
MSLTTAELDAMVAKAIVDAYDEWCRRPHLVSSDAAECLAPYQGVAYAAARSPRSKHPRYRPGAVGRSVSTRPLTREREVVAPRSSPGLLERGRVRACEAVGGVGGVPVREAASAGEGGGTAGGQGGSPVSLL